MINMNLFFLKLLMIIIFSVMIIMEIWIYKQISKFITMIQIKTTKFLVNDFNWDVKSINFDSD